jgi:hypothetical protein
MRHKSLLLFCVLVIVGAYYLADHAHDQSIKTTEAHIRVVAKQELSTRQKLENEVTSDNTEAATLKAQCAVGLEDYNLLTTVQRLHATEPNCTVDTAIAK